MHSSRSRFSRPVTPLIAFVMMLPILAAALSVAPPAALAAPPGTTGAATIGPATEVHGPPRTASVPTLTPEQLAIVDRATARSNRPYAPVPDDPTAVRRSGAPQAAPLAPTPPPAPPARTVGVNPATLVAFQNNPIGAGARNGFKSTTGEPSVASSGSVIFWTGNWYAAVSADGGNTFTFINPFTFFPSVNGGFCCDQEVIYDPTRGIFIWELQYIPDTLPGGNTNTIRIAVATPAQALANNWFTYNITPTLFGWNATTEFDYPNVSLSSNFFYLSENVFINGASQSMDNTLMRLPLATLAVHGPLTFNFFNGPVGMVPVQGATTTMYFASHNTTTSLNLWSWLEASPNPILPAIVVNHARYGLGVHNCLSPDTFDACADDDTRIKTGWLAGGVIGFMWDVGQGTDGLGTFTFPYVDAVRIDATTSALIDQPIIFSTTTAYAFPGVGVNGRGAIGGSIAFSGGTNFPSSAIFVHDDFTTGTWDLQTTALGTNGPARNRWGDYLTARPADGGGNTWLAATYTQQGPCPLPPPPNPPSSQCNNVVPRYVRFGRQRDNPFIPVSPPPPGRAGSGTGGAPAPPPARR